MAKPAKLDVDAPKPARTYGEVAGELYEIDALIAGADAIVHDIFQTGDGPEGDLELDALNAHKLLRAAAAKIMPLAEMIEQFGKQSARSGGAAETITVQAIASSTPVEIDEEHPAQQRIVLAERATHQLILLLAELLDRITVAHDDEWIVNTALVSRAVKLADAACRLLATPADEIDLEACDREVCHG